MDSQAALGSSRSGVEHNPCLSRVEKCCIQHCHRLEIVNAPELEIDEVSPLEYGFCQHNNRCYLLPVRYEITKHQKYANTPELQHVL